MGRRNAQIPPATGNRRRDMLIALGLAAITWIVYGPAYQFDFVVYDDNVYVYLNRHVMQGLTWDSIKWALTSETVGNWQPVMSLSLLLDVTLFGGKAPGFHFTNIVLHTANTLLLFVLLKQMTRAVWNSAFVAALFAVHPLHVESVAWISERKDVLSAFFGLLSILAYCRYSRNGGWKFYVVALATFFLSLASKPMLVTLPFLLLLLDFWPLQRTRWISPDDMEAKTEPQPVKSRSKTTTTASDIASAAIHTPVLLPRLLLEKVPYFLVTLVFSIVAFATQESGGGVASTGLVSMPIRLANAVLVYALYILKTFWPVDLAMFYPHPRDSISLAAVAIAALFLLSVTAFVVLQWRRRPYLLVGWLWYLGTLVPVIGFVQLGMQQMADRYTYIPLIGFFIAFTWFVSSLLPQPPKQPFWVWGIVLAPLVGCMALARSQVYTWQDSFALASHAIAVTENNFYAHYMRGVVFDSRGQLEDAVREYQRSVAIEPQLAKSRADLGAALSALGRLQEAVPHLKAALAIDPSLAEAHVNLGVALFRLGQSRDGFAHLQQAVTLAPSNVNAHINLGNALEMNRQYEEAIDHFRQAAELDPENWLPHFKLGERYQARGDLDQAEAEYRLAIRSNPEISDAYSNLGVLLLKRGNRKESVEFFRKAVQLNPRDSRARQHLQQLRVR